MKRNALTSGHVRVVHLPLLFASVVVLSSAADAADRIILRNLKIFTDKTVTSFDEDGVRLDDSTVLGWHEIEKARIAPDRQEAFDEMLAAVGNDLYRIRQRLSVGDYEGLLPHAEALAPRYSNRTSDTAYMVLQSLMWGRLAAGDREQALTPYLQCYALLRFRSKTKIDLPGERGLQFAPRSGLSKELIPVWFDPESAKAVLPTVYKTVRDMKVRPAGVYLYLGTLASAAGNDKMAASVLGALRSNVREVSELKQILQAQREVLAGKPGPFVDSLTRGFGDFTTDNKPLAMYWVGRSWLLAAESDRKQEGLLQLLRIPALYGETQPDLAAGALFEVMQTLEGMKDVRGSVTVRRELLAEYSNTYHARRLKNEDN